MLTGEDAVREPSHSEVVDHNTEDQLDSERDAAFYDYSYNDADQYVNVTADTQRT